MCLFVLLFASQSLAHSPAFKSYACIMSFYYVSCSNPIPFFIKSTYALLISSWECEKQVRLPYTECVCCNVQLADYIKALLPCTWIKIMLDYSFTLFVVHKIYTRIAYTRTHAHTHKYCFMQHIRHDTIKRRWTRITKEKQKKKKKEFT